MSLRIIELEYQVQSFRLGPINLTVNNEYFVLMGPTGSGKSTLLRLVAGAHRPRKGRIIINGMDVTTLPPEKRGVSFVPQDYALFSIMSVRRNIEFGLRARGYPRDHIDKAVSSIASQLGIDGLLARSPATLSGGERQKVALARALVSGAKILLLDEPLSMLDPHSRMEFMELLKDVRRRYELTIMHVTHDFEEAYSLADRIGVIMGGQLRYVGDKETLFNEPSDVDVASFVGYRNNVVDGKVLGIDGLLFIRPEWIELGTGVLEGTVITVIDSLNGFYVEISINGNRLVAFSKRRPKVGEKVNINIVKHHVIKK